MICTPQVSSGQHPTNVTRCWSCRTRTAPWACRWFCPVKGRAHSPSLSPCSLLVSWPLGTPACEGPRWTFSCPGDKPALRLKVLDFRTRLRIHNVVWFRFRMQKKFSLRSVLPALGISDAFNPTLADLTGISGQLITYLLSSYKNEIISTRSTDNFWIWFPAAEEGLYVSDAFHEVRIEVTEEGTKASAATGQQGHAFICIGNH